MCSPPRVDNTASQQASADADEARAREEARQGRIADGRVRINNALDGRTWDAGDTGTETEAYRAWAGRQGGNTGDRQWGITGWSGSESPSPEYGWLTSGGNSPEDPAPTRYEGGREAGWRQTGGGFNDDFFRKRHDAVLDFYQPELNRQHEDAQRAITFDLANRGLTNSTEAGRQQGRLTEAFGVEAGRIAAKANDAVVQSRTDVERTRSELINQLEATSDVEGAANAATARTATLQQAPIPTAPLGDVFAGLLSAGANIYAGRQNYGITSATNNSLTPQSARSGQSSSVR